MTANPISPQRDTLNWSVNAHLQRWDDESSWKAGLDPDSEDDYAGNLLLNAGITRLLNRLISDSTQEFDAANCRIGVGNSSTAASASQTDLQAAAGAGNRQFELCDSVSVSAQTLTVVATFESGDANFAWEEWGVDQGTADGTTVVAPMLNRKVASMGTKASGAVWVLTITITVS